MNFKTDYYRFSNINGTQVGPLNFAPFGTYDKFDHSIPISQLKYLPSPTRDDCNFNYFRVDFSE